MLSQLLRQLFTDNPLVAFPTVGLAIFMTVFCIVSFNVLRRRASSYDEIARLPLADEHTEEVRRGR